MNVKTTDIGVIVGRFQTNELHAGHKEIIQQVISSHDKVIIFLGISQAINTKRNPLDFITRKLMIEHAFPTGISAILPLIDKYSDSVWSKQIDYKVREVFPTGSVTLYGSRDSCLSSYLGDFKTLELSPSMYISATNIRESVSKKTLQSSDFRAGVIYSVYSSYPTAYPTVDLLIFKGGNVLLGKKDGENMWRFIGGFVDPTDLSLEAAAKREGYEETGLELANFKYLFSSKINDWRYSKVADKGIITTVFSCDFIFGSPSPGDDIAALKWFTLEELKTNYSDILIEGHSKIFQTYLENGNYQ